LGLWKCTSLSDTSLDQENEPKTPSMFVPLVIHIQNVKLLLTLMMCRLFLPCQMLTCDSILVSDETGNKTPFNLWKKKKKLKSSSSSSIPRLESLGFCTHKSRENNILKSNITSLKKHLESQHHLLEQISIFLKSHISKTNIFFILLRFHPTN